MIDSSNAAPMTQNPCYVPCGLELNKIYNENNLETMARMPDNFIDLTVTSPPYDNLREYKGYEFDFESIAKELFRVTKKGGVVVWVVGDATINGSETGTSFRQALYFKEIGFNLHDTMIYDKGFAKFPDAVRYGQSFEYMFVLSKGVPKTFNPIKTESTQAGNKKEITDREKNCDTKKSKATINEYKTERNVWLIDSGFNRSSRDELAFEHPAIFPENLAKLHIVSWSNENDIVYDCFGGSGTTAKMAHLMKRNWILSEISSEYVQIAEKRIAPYLAQTSLF